MDRLVRRASSVLGCPLDSVEVVGNGRMMAKLSSLLNNTSHPLQDSLTALGSSFSERLLHPRCVKERIQPQMFCGFSNQANIDVKTKETKALFVNIQPFVFGSEGFPGAAWAETGLQASDRLIHPVLHIGGRQRVESPAIKNTFVNNLNKGIKDQLALHELPDEFEDLVDLAVQIDNRLQEREAERRQAGRRTSKPQGANFGEFCHSPGSSAPTVAEDRAPPPAREEPMQLGRTK
ncbi:hypothetical protein L3Q82_017014 [Scortum barcoo]|uniref:Uncharacterized protein n=1 Tax=Scortum barcoo TaxID=214431 RepID=A0ACB8X9F7_9TELE|nr:hypothetical protein L3Q82_017014 [Scortum barcoo]